MSFEDLCARRSNVKSKNTPRLVPVCFCVQLAAVMAHVVCLLYHLSVLLIAGSCECCIDGQARMVH